MCTICVYLKLHISQGGFQSQWNSIFVTSCEGPVDGTVYPPAEPCHSCVDSWKLGIPANVSPGGEPVKSSIAHKQLSRIRLEHHNTCSIEALTSVSKQIIIRVQHELGKESGKVTSVLK